MERSISPSSTRPASSTSVPEAGARQQLALIGIGAALAFAHRALDFDLGLPGHFGLVWMAAVMATRQWSAARWAATVTACGYVGGSAALTALAPHGLTQTLYYLLVTLAVDLAWRGVGAARLQQLWLAALVGGLAFLLKPLAFMLVARGLPHGIGALRFGPVYPLITHACFGATGAVIGTLLARLRHESLSHRA